MAQMGLVSYLRLQDGGWKLVLFVIWAATVSRPPRPRSFSLALSHPLAEMTSTMGNEQRDGGKGKGKDGSPGKEGERELASGRKRPQQRRGLLIAGWCSSFGRSLPEMLLTPHKHN